MEGYNCIGCSPDNPFGLHLCFYEDGDDIVTTWKPAPLSRMAQHASWRHTGPAAGRGVRMGCNTQVADGWRDVKDGDTLQTPRLNKRHGAYRESAHKRAKTQHRHHRCHPIQL